MSLRLRQAALLAGILIAGLVIGAPGVGGQQPMPTVPPTPPGPPIGIEVPRGRVGDQPLPPVAAVPPAPSLVTEPLAPAISSGFDGIGMEVDDDNFIHTPPDTHAAAGPSSIVEVTNGHVAIFDKTGAIIAGGAPSVTGTPVDLDAFCGREGCFDPKVIYDQGSQRFVAVVVEGRDLSTSFLHIMVSTDSTPSNLTTDWDKFRHASGTTISSTNGWFDYPGLGVSPDALVVTGNIFSETSPFPFLGTKIRVFDKTELYDGDATATFTDIDRDPSVGATVQPAHHLSDPPAGTFYLLQRWNATNLNVLVLTGLPGSPSVSAPQLLTTANQGGCVDSAPQQGTNKDIDTICLRMMNAVWRDGSLWGTNTGSGASRAIVQWFEVETNGFPSATPTVRQHGVIDGGSGEYTYMPSISVDACNNTALTYTQSSSSRFPEMRYTGRLFGDALNSMQTPVVAKASAFSHDDFSGGSGPFAPPERWGDYSATVIDPIDQSFWVANEYVKTNPSGPNNSRWGTWLTNFSFGCSPVDIALTTNGSVAFGVQALTVTVDTTGSGINDVETVQVTTGPADLLIKSTAFSDGGNTWTLGASNGADQVKWEFSTDGSTWATFTTADALFTLANGVAETASTNIFFRLTMPTSTASASEHGATVTIVAVVP